MDEKLNQVRLILASKKLCEMREKKILTDVVLKCKGGSIHAHRCVLMATSAFFYDLFCTSLNGDSSIQMDYFDRCKLDVMVAVVKTLYGDVPRTFKNFEQLVDVLDVSHTIDEMMLFNYCMKLAMQQLTVDNCVHLWRLTSKYERKKEEIAVKRVMADHMTQVLMSKQLDDLTVDQMTDFVKFASESDAVSERLVMAVIQWSKTNRDQKPDKLVALFNLVEKLVFPSDGRARNSSELLDRLVSAKDRLVAIVNKSPEIPASAVSSECSTSVFGPSCESDPTEKTTRTDRTPSPEVFPHNTPASSAWVTSLGVPTVSFSGVNHSSNAKPAGRKRKVRSPSEKRNRAVARSSNSENCELYMSLHSDASFYRDFDPKNDFHTAGSCSNSPENRSLTPPVPTSWATTPFSDLMTLYGRPTKAPCHDQTSINSSPTGASSHPTTPISSTSHLTIFASHTTTPNSFSRTVTSSQTLPSASPISPSSQQTSNDCVKSSKSRSNPRPKSLKMPTVNSRPKTPKADFSHTSPTTSSCPKIVNDGPTVNSRPKTPKIPTNSSPSVPTTPNDDLASHPATKSCPKSSPKERPVCRPTISSRLKSKSEKQMPNHPSISNRPKITAVRQKKCTCSPKTPSGQACTKICRPAARRPVGSSNNNNNQRIASPHGNFVNKGRYSSSRSNNRRPSTTISAISTSNVSTPSKSSSNTSSAADFVLFFDHKTPRFLSTDPEENTKRKSPPSKPKSSAFSSPSDSQSANDKVLPFYPVRKCPTPACSNSASTTSFTTARASVPRCDVSDTSVVESKIGTEPKEIRIHFYCADGVQNVQLKTQMYSTFKRKWTTLKDIRLSDAVASNWYPLISVYGEQFYFAVSCEKKFVVFSAVTGVTYTGPAVKFQSRVAGVVDGPFIYVWNYESIARFDTESCTWKALSPNPHVFAGWSNLLAANGQLYFHGTFPPAIYKYDFARDEWELNKAFKETSNTKSIKCKCFQRLCKKKLYFIANERQLLTFDTEANEWSDKFLPEFESRVPLLMNCDESFIVFGDKRNRSQYFLYYPETNKLDFFENNQIMYNERFVTCDVTF